MLHTKKAFNVWFWFWINAFDTKTKNTNFSFQLFKIYLVPLIHVVVYIFCASEERERLLYFLSIHETIVDTIYF